MQPGGGGRLWRTFLVHLFLIGTLAIGTGPTAWAETLRYSGNVMSPVVGLFCPGGNPTCTITAWFDFASPLPTINDLTYSTVAAPTSWSASVGDLTLGSASGASLSFVFGVHDSSTISANWVAVWSRTVIGITQSDVISSCFGIGGPISSLGSNYCTSVSDSWARFVGFTSTGGGNFGSPGAWTSSVPEPSGVFLLIIPGFWLALGERVQRLCKRNAKSGQ